MEDFFSLYSIVNNFPGKFFRKGPNFKLVTYKD
jgi:hypothetical protein